MGQRRYPELNRSTPLSLNWTNRQEQKTRSSSIQRQAALQALATCELACFNPTPALQNPGPEFNAPATGIPLHALGSVVDRVDRGVVNNSHSMGVTSAGGSTSWTCTAHSAPTGKPSRWRWRGRPQRQGAKPQRQCRVAGRLRPPTWHLQLEVGAHRLCGYSSPDKAFGPLDTPVPRGPNQQIDPRRARSGQHVIDIGFSVPDAHQPGRGTAVMGSVHGVETVEPFLPFFLADGELLAPRPFPQRPGPGPQPVALRAPKARARA